MLDGRVYFGGICTVDKTLQSLKCGPIYYEDSVNSGLGSSSNQNIFPWMIRSTSSGNTMYLYSEYTFGAGKADLATNDPNWSEIFQISVGSGVGGGGLILLIIILIIVIIIFVKCKISQKRARSPTTVQLLEEIQVGRLNSTNYINTDLNSTISPQRNFSFHNKEDVLLKSFESVRVLGKGGAGEVYLVKTSTDEQVALKKIKCEEEAMFKSCQREVRNL